MKWLITGGCGFIGSNLANSLLKGGEEVIILDNLSRLGSESNLKWLREQYKNNFLFCHADTISLEAVSSIIKENRPDVIAHLAGQVAMTTSLANPRLDFEVNAIGTINILDSVRQYSSSTIVMYSSTNKVYGALDQIPFIEMEKRYVLPDYPNGLNEDIQLDGLSPYGCSKLCADQYTRDFFRMFGIRTVVFRHSSMYGGRQFATYDQGWIGWFCQKALEMSIPNAPAFSISGNGKQVRDVLHAEDLIQVYKLAAKNIDITAGKIYNIGGGMENSLSLLELFDLLEHLSGNTLRYYKLDWRVGDQKVFVADTTRARIDFGWSPKVDKVTGIRHMLNWCKEVISGE